MPANTAFQYVEVGPRFTPLKFGLLSTADVVDDGDVHWKGGIEWQPDPCGPDSTVAVFCAPGGPATGIGKTPTVVSNPNSAAEPFTLLAYTDCAPVGYTSMDEYEARAMRAMDRGENRAVERVVWTGAPTVGPTIRPHLAANAQEFANPQGAATLELQSAAQVVTGTGEFRAMFGLLEGELASCYGGEGIIHVPARAAAHLFARNLVTVQGPMLRSGLGTKVAIYSSNNREGPTGAVPAANLGWLYATGNVAVRRGQAMPRGKNPGEYVGKSKNDTVYVIERTYVVDWDCCHLAAQVDFTL